MIGETHDLIGYTRAIHGEKFDEPALPTRRNSGEPLPQTRRAVTRNAWASRSLASFVVSLG